MDEVIFLESKFDPTWTYRNRPKLILRLQFKNLLLEQNMNTIIWTTKHFNLIIYSNEAAASAQLLYRP